MTKYVDASRWPLDYALKADGRTLISLPGELKRDIKMLASIRGISVSEQIRTSVMDDIARYISAHPEHALSFRGKLVELSAQGTEDPKEQ